LITDGLKVNERIVYEGLQKVKDGAVVTTTVIEPKLVSEEKK
jgi:membrane fusion protein (multidrug efflux system)